MPRPRFTPIAHGSPRNAPLPVGASGSLSRLARLARRGPRTNALTFLSAACREPVARFGIHGTVELLSTERSAGGGGRLRRLVASPLAARSVACRFGTNAIV